MGAPGRSRGARQRPGSVQRRTQAVPPEIDRLPEGVARNEEASHTGVQTVRSAEEPSDDPEVAGAKELSQYSDDGKFRRNREQRLDVCRVVFVCVARV